MNYLAREARRTDLDRSRTDFARGHASARPRSEVIAMKDGFLASAISRVELPHARSVRAMCPASSQFDARSIGRGVGAILEFIFYRLVLAALGVVLDAAPRRRSSP